MGRPSMRAGRVAATLGRGVLGEDESRRRRPRAFSTMNSERPRWALDAVGVGTGQQHEHVGPGREGAPRLHPVDQPAAARSAWRR